ncbi:MAG: DNA translocase FtsK, partial [Lachnospiraceae bacterium]|nr:DNA translocase FtsK [Lachnospiraceae bacterium]
MLFYPQGYSKPARIQGAFVSDKEVSDVVDFLKNQMIGNTYAEDIEEKIRNMGNGGGSGASGGSSGGNSGLDEYFEQAGRFVIENADKNKASVGSLQRLLKIGFNRAARIMDQLCEYGVVGEAEGTKARKVLMTMEEFDALLQTL